MGGPSRAARRTAHELPMRGHRSRRRPSRGGCRWAEDSSGQATLEAAFLIPVVFLLVLLLVQPGIILYDMMVMRAAAADGCRLLATRTDALGDSLEACEAYVKRRLGAVPEQDLFHIHDEACSWSISLAGDECSEFVEVTISNRVRLLPLMGSAAAFLGAVDRNGEYVFEVSVCMRTQPRWAAQGDAGINPKDWVKGVGDG